MFGRARKNISSLLFLFVLLGPAVLCASVLEEHNGITREKRGIETSKDQEDNSSDSRVGVPGGFFGTLKTISDAVTDGVSVVRDIISLVTRITVNDKGNAEKGEAQQLLNNEIADVQNTMSNKIDSFTKTMENEVERSRNEFAAHKADMKKRMGYIELQGKYIQSGINDLQIGITEGFADTKNQITKMSNQAKNLQKSSQSSLKKVSNSLQSLHSQVALIDEDILTLRKETKAAMEEINKMMEEKTDKILNNIDTLSSYMQLGFTENASLIVNSTTAILDEISSLSSQINKLFDVIDKSIARSEQTAANILKEIHEQTSTQLYEIDANLQQIQSELARFRDVFDSSMDDLLAELRQIKITLQRDQIQQDLIGYIDDIKGVVDAWATMLEYSANNASEDMLMFKVYRFKALCMSHNPLSVLTWMERNIYDAIKSDATTIPEESFYAWQKGVLSLRNDAYVLYGACLLAQDWDQATYDTEMNSIYEQMFSDNFLQQADSLDKLYYAQWWRQTMNESGLVSVFESATQDEVEAKLLENSEWLQFMIEKQDHVNVFTVETEENDTVSTEQLIDLLHSNSPKRKFNQSYFFCCQAHFDLCYLRTEHNRLHVCFGRSVWLRPNSDQSVLVINWWPTSIGQNYSRIPDNFFIQQGSESKAGFALPDMSLHTETWRQTKTSVQILSDENQDRSKRWKWTVLLTDNICWWKQGESGDCTNNQCQWQNDTGVSGPVMKFVNGVGKEKCCALCAGINNCVAVAWSEQRICILYARFNRTIAQTRWMTASKLKDCTQCTDTAMDGCGKDCVIDDATINHSDYSIIQNITETQCEQECFNSFPLCLSYSWRLTDEGPVCQLNDQHGPIQPVIGSSLTLGLAKWQNSDCVISEWSEYGRCSVECGNGVQYRTRTVIIEPSGSGKECPTLSQSQQCYDSCNVAKILVIGGYHVDASSSMQLYHPFNPEHNHVLTVKMIQKRYAHTSALMDDGAVITVGGLYDSTYLSHCERFNPSTSTVTQCASLNTPRLYHGSAVLVSFMYVVVGMMAAGCNRVNNSSLTFGNTLCQ